MLKEKLNHKIESNFLNVKLEMFIPALLLIFFCFLYYLMNSNGGDYKQEYVNIQKDLFYYLNHNLSPFSDFQLNITQLGDVLIFFAFVTILIVYAPKFWEALLTSALLSLLASAILKKIFSIPRPAAMLDNDSFTIIGKTLTGSNSLPSGHSIATFVLISTVTFAFMPKRIIMKVIWVTLMMILGFLIAFSRVGVGAHYPIDVIVGSSIGYMVTVVGILIINKYKWLAWLRSKKCYKYFIFILIVWIIAIIEKLTLLNLPVFYLALLGLVITLFFILKNYVQIKKDKSSIFFFTIKFH